MQDSFTIDDETFFETKLTGVKNDFNKLKDACIDIDNVFEILHIKIDKLQQYYSEFIKSSGSQLMIFGLDSFNFQNRLIQNDTKNMQQIQLMLFNRIYADYYKLYNIVTSYIKGNLKNSKVHAYVTTTNKTFPKYNYLDIYEKYEFNISNDVFYEIVNLIQQLYDYCKNLYLQLQNYKQKKNIGLQIDNFVYTHEYRLHTLNTQLKLYMNYIDFFISTHTNYLKRFITRLKIIHCQIANDIKLDSMNNKYGSMSASSSPTSLFMESEPVLKSSGFVNSETNVVLEKTILTPKERSEVQKMLDDVSVDSSELAKTGISSLLEDSPVRSRTDSESIEMVTIDSGVIVKPSTDVNINQEKATDEHTEDAVGISVEDLHIEETIVEETTVSEINVDEGNNETDDKIVKEAVTNIVEQMVVSAVENVENNKEN